MKNILFAAQVFGIIAMFPIVVILEINHTKPGSSKTNIPSGIMQHTIKASIAFTEKIKDKEVIETYPLMLETFLLKKVF